jgi:6-phosphofructokinase 1
MATRIGILSGGGDCAGINAAIKWVVKTALEAHRMGMTFEIVGIREGWRGLVEEDFMPGEINKK